MSQPFTTPAGQTWQTLLSEITLAYSERRQAISQSAYVPEDRNVQSAAYWAGLQGWMETYCTSFVDHVNGPLNPAGDAFLYFTLETWRAAAGLNVNGFRRSPLTGGTAYGQMQIGDAIGPWIFEELQKGFGALQYRPYLSSLVNLKNAGLATGAATLVAYGGGPVWMGVFYPFTADDRNWPAFDASGIIGSSGTFNIVIDNSKTDSISIGHGYISFVSLGIAGSAIQIQLDSGASTPVVSNNYSCALTLDDLSGSGGFFSADWYYQRAAVKNISISGNTITASAVLTSGNTPPGDYAMMRATPYFKVPFTNA